ncbi:MULTISPECIES: nucleotidyl transferase AbiEii/AbiGii toxin family protein [Pseudoalteromonas]|uniref:nucleotidyl transferase AbiEii/AbiGii toxin family protein n=1 Tax=Pseudoalteromonas TaxID=53246 RepID=UPI0015827084|nr:MULTISPECIES: nucleotidyl transferase AbiEii/AbiGii toxin family protein [Pseudoalteromonas]MDI4650576.1 nucleotidyl transferase AbiEii/AbiGii toxin family protein [Pseudoalteromonas shioyasakiensis]NUJ36995.1 nucleotidyl transferase AbiEii/AbiGii toxin family protein [Pseudoalteromonas sp. 0303]
MDIFALYRDETKRGDLKQIFNDASQKHPDGLGEAFIEKDIWVTELLKLLFDEGLLEGKAVAFKGGTALSKRWKAIERFSEDIDLSIHWHDMLNGDKPEAQAWAETTVSNSQNKKFREAQTQRLEEWTLGFFERLKAKIDAYGIKGLQVSYLNSEKIEVHYPIVAEQRGSRYHLGPVLLEFGARNRGKPTEPSKLTTYLSEIEEYEEAFSLPVAENVLVFDPSYIIWEKMTALHQFCTSEKQPNAARLARHWYDVDCMMCKGIVDPLRNHQAIYDVVEMKSARWGVKGVDFSLASTGKLRLIPDEPLRTAIAQDYAEMVEGGMYFSKPDEFSTILDRLRSTEKMINESLILSE